MAKKAQLSDPLKQCQKVLTFLVNHKDSTPFRQPVDWQGWNLLDYPQVIKHPMDLSSVQQKLDAGEYNTPAELAHDVRLIWNNCKTYNQDGSEYYMLADRMAKLFEEKFSKIQGAEDAEEARPPSLDEKTRFSQNIYRITSEQLGKMVMILDDNCESAIDKTNPDEIEINVDAIDTATFRMLERFVVECLPKRAKKKRPAEEGAARKKART